MVKIVIILNSGFVIRGDVQRDRVEVLRSHLTYGLWLPMQRAESLRPGDTEFFAMGELHVCTDSMSAWTVLA